jgi:hypothetical protein
MFGCEMQDFTLIRDVNNAKTLKEVVPANSDNSSKTADPETPQERQ